MDKKEYNQTRKEYQEEADLIVEEEVVEKTYDKRGKEIPADVEEALKQGEKIHDKAYEEAKNNAQENTEQGKALDDLTRAEIEDLPDLGEFMETEEFLRMGTDAKIPYSVEIGGKNYKIYIRPLGANEFYKLQLKQIRDKEDLDYLAVEKVCTDSHGNKLPPSLLDKLGFNIIKQIGSAIRIASGADQDEDQTQEVITNLLKE